jgi:hypothetical protein
MPWPRPTSSLPLCVRGRCQAERYSQCRQDRGQIRPFTRVFGDVGHVSPIRTAGNRGQARVSADRKPELPAGMIKAPTDR